MIDFIREQLSSGSMVVALPFALLVGLISFLSPCVLPLVPGYIAYATGFSSTKGRVLLGSILFVAGFTFIFTSFGLAFGGLGSKFTQYEDVLTIFLGVFTIAMGVLFMGVFPFAPTVQMKMSTTGGIAGAPILGFLFGLSWTPCIGPGLAAVQTLAFTESSATRGAILSIGYSLGLGIPFILSGLYLDKSKKLRTFLLGKGATITKVGGLLLIVIGILQVTGLWLDLMIWLRSYISPFTPVL
jgi:cytochrome c-type biogenesis protein